MKHFFLTSRIFPKEKEQMHSLPSSALVESNFRHWKVTFPLEGCLSDFKTILQNKPYRHVVFISATGSGNSTAPGQGIHIFQLFLTTGLKGG